MPPGAASAADGGFLGPAELRVSRLKAWLTSDWIAAFRSSSAVAARSGAHCAANGSSRAESPSAHASASAEVQAHAARARASSSRSEAAPGVRASQGQSEPGSGPGGQGQGSYMEGMDSGHGLVG